MVEIELAKGSWSSFSLCFLFPIRVFLSCRRYILLIVLNILSVNTLFVLIHTLIAR